MAMNLFLLLSLTWLPTRAGGAEHLLRFVTFCDKDEPGNGQEDIEFDGDQLLYVNASTYRIFQRLPEFARQWTPDPTLDKVAYLDLGTCQYNIPRCLKGENFPPEVIVPPVSSIYPKQDAELGVPNTLICSLRDFHPPLVRITWTRNGEPVDQSDVSQTLYYSNPDYSFRTASYLQVVPQQGDIYSCSVDHIGLQAPLTKFWEVAVYTEQQTVETCVCVCGVILGAIGLLTGLGLAVRANRSCRP